MASRITWGVLVVLYVTFFGWYTSCGGPLTEEEVESYMALIEERSVPTDPEGPARMRAFLESDTGDDFVMVNIIDLHETPVQIEGVAPGDTAQETSAKYMAYMFPALLARACHPVFAGSAVSEALEMFGVEGMREWHQAVGMRYRSRRDMLEIVTNPAFQGSHEFKVAAIDKTVAFPVDPWYSLGDPRILLFLVFLVIGLTASWRSERAKNS